MILRSSNAIQVDCCTTANSAFSGVYRGPQEASCRRHSLSEIVTYFLQFNLIPSFLTWVTFWMCIPGGPTTWGNFISNLHRHDGSQLYVREPAYTNHRHWSWCSCDTIWHVTKVQVTFGTLIDSNLARFVPRLLPVLWMPVCVF